MSRYDHERDLRPRLTSTLGRQLERFREVVPVWNAQKQALQCALTRKEQVVQQQRKEVEALVAEREQTDRLYADRFDALCRGLAHERDKAAGQGVEAEKQLERSRQEEAVTTQALTEEDNRHAKLKSSLDQTVAQLDEVNANMEKCKAIIDEWANQPPEDPTPEMMQTLRQIEDTLKAREQIRSQARTIRSEVMLAQDELQRQRSYSQRMEEFVRKVSSGGGRYVIHPSNKREAARLLAAAARLRAAAGLQALDEAEVQQTSAGNG